MDNAKDIAMVAAIGAGAFVAAPVVGSAAIGLLGFKAGGIAAGSWAAAMMSASATASGGGVAATGLVAILQSAGVLGLGSTTGVVAGSVASGATAAVTFLRK